MQRIITLFKKQSTIFVLLLDILSVFTAVVIFREQDKPACFNLLPLMPLAYMAVSTLFRQLFDEIPDNLGATLILAFEAVKMVVIPLVIHYSNYHAYFDREYFDNMPAAVLLTVYECVAVFLVMAVLAARKRKSQENTQTNTQTEIKTYTTNEKWYRIILIALLVIAVIMIVIAPQSLGGYRTLIKLGDEEYTHLDVSDLIYTQSTGFINRFAMVMQRNILLVLRLVIPAVIIIALSKKRYTMLIALLVAATPFLIVDDTIGRSLYYSVILCYLVYYIYKPRYAKPLIAVAGVLAFAFLAVYWRIRYSASESSYNSFVYISRTLNGYFGGIYMTTAALNLKTSLRVKFIFFIADILKSIPFGNTIFRVGHIRYFQGYFNQFNYSYGKIPSSLGVGKFYFGYLLAPIYSCIFAGISYANGRRAIEDPNPYRKLTCLIMALIFAFGFNMYTVQSTFTLFFYLAAPVMILEWMTRKRKPAA